MGFAPNSDVAAQLAIGLLLNADVHQSVLAKHTLGIKVCSKEPTFSIKCRSDVKLPYKSRKNKQSLANLVKLNVKK